MAELYAVGFLTSKFPELRIGHGIDVHQLVPGRRLMLGGVQIEYDRGLAGHSDADALLHALIDALLGAAGLPDIGQQFPNNDPQWRGVASLELLGVTWVKISALGWQLINADCCISAEAPKLAPYLSQMTQAIAQRLQQPASKIGIKAGTSEGLGFVGHGQGILASCVVLLLRDA